ncbi:sn-glycerol-3-phosphate ABC transporter ATP-binding protein UgpC [Mycoplasmatota bacterium zrk1]
MATLNFKGLNKIYPNGVHAVYDFDLEVKDKEFIIFVGPSGCGKSTTLRMVAGLEEISSGELYIDDILINNVAPKDRDIAMVFQNYALYPHMTVYDNMAFGLKLRKMDKGVIEEKVKNAAEILGLTEYLNRKPKALSGGQRQRVALGRAIVRNAKVFLMDEPLSNLDAKLRVQMRAEIGKLHAKLETTTIYVTHDQIEAMTMASRIVVMKDGYIQQVGPPKEIYDYPANVFVGSFIGTPPMNFFKGIIKDNEFTSSSMVLTISKERVEELKRLGYENKEIYLGIRPEHVYDMKSNDQLAEVSVNLVELVGSESVIHATTGETDFVAKVGVRTDISIGDTISISFDLDKAHFFDVKTEERIKIKK